MKRVFSLIAICIVSMSIGAAPTLQQRVNAEKGIADTTTATFVDKVGQGIKQIAQDIVNGTIVPSDTFISNHANVSQSQLIEFALRSLRGGMNSYLIPSIMDDPRLANNFTASTDNQIRNAIKQCIWPFAVLIGNGQL